MFFGLFLAVFIAFSSLILAAFIDGAEFVFATDPRVHYEPPLSDPVWSNCTNSFSPACVEASDSIATATLEFYGTSIALMGVARTNYARLLVSLDGEAHITPVFPATGMEVAAYTNSSLDPTRAHRITIQKSFDASPADSWNILYFGIGNGSEPMTTSLVPDPSIPTSASPMITYTEIPDVIGKSAQKRSETVIIGTIVGILAVIGSSILAFVLLYWRHRSVRSLLPEANPYNITPEQSSPRILMSYKRLRVSSRWRIERQASTAATACTNEDVDSSVSVIHQTPEADTNRADERISSPDSQQGQLLRSQSPAYIISNDPFSDPEILEIRKAASQVATLGSSLSRDSSLPSISPPPSYRTTDT